MTEYNDRRSKHAIAVDKGINAKQRHGDFNKDYKNAPNRSDVQDYDHYIVKKKGKKRKYVKIGRKEPRPAEGEREGEYLPTAAEKEALVKRFHKEPAQAQYEDLLRTKDVAHTKADVKEWKKNPQGSDIRTVDTRPRGYHKARVDVGYKAIGSPVTVKVSRVRGGNNPLGGFFNYEGEHIDKETFHTYRSIGHRKTTVEAKDVPRGWIELKKNRTEKETTKTFAHEIGHGYDRNVVGRRENYVKNPYDKGTGNVKFYGKEKEQMFKMSLKQRPIQEHGSSKHLTEKEAMIMSPSHVRYRKLDKEIFADYVGGVLLYPKRTAKNAAPSYHKKFKKENPKLFKGLKGVDKKFLMPRIKLKKGEKLKLF